MSQGGFVSRELLGEKLEALRQAGTHHGADVHGYRYSAEMVQAMEKQPRTGMLDEAAALGLIEMVVHALAISPGRMMVEGPAMVDILGHCQPFIFTQLEGTVLHVGFPEDYESDSEPLPWAATDRATVLKATMAAIHLGRNSHEGPALGVVMKIAGRVVEALADPAAAEAVQAELAAAKSDASVSDILYDCNYVVAESLKDLVKSEPRGSAERAQLLARRREVAEAMVQGKPEFAQGYLLLSLACCEAGEWAAAVAAAEKGIGVADAAQDRFHGAFLRHALGLRLVEQAGHTGGSVSVGVLRSLMEEALACMDACKAWAPSSAQRQLSAGELSQYLKSFKDKGDDEEVQFDLVSGEQASTQGSFSFTRRCANCRLLLADAKRCGACKSVFYCSATCQRAHWPQHKAECKRRQAAAS